MYMLKYAWLSARVENPVSQHNAIKLQAATESASAAFSFSNIYLLKKTGLLREIRLRQKITGVLACSQSVIRSLSLTEPYFKTIQIYLLYIIYLY